MNPTRKRAIEELRRMVLDALGEHDAAVWLFGSCAQGQPRQHSDIDIDILPRGDLPSGFFAELEADIEDSTIPYDVDLRCAERALVEEVQHKEMAGLARRLAEAEAALATLEGGCSGIPLADGTGTAPSCGGSIHSRPYGKPAMKRLPSARISRLRPRTPRSALPGGLAGYPTMTRRPQ
jgi:predicted nucleotidyltransferase